MPIIFETNKINEDKLISISKANQLEVQLLNDKIRNLYNKNMDEERIKVKKERLKQVMKEDTCIFCGDLTIIWYESRYNGYMGRCDRCKSEWRES